MDTNNDGKLSREELLSGYKRIMDPEEAEIEVTRVMEIVDADGSGHIDYSGKFINKKRICNCNYK